MKTILVKILLLFSIVGFSQSESQNDILISGIVMSEVNNKPLENVTIRINLSGAISDKKGRFYFKYHADKKDSLKTIVFSALGYETIDSVIDLRKNKRFKFNFILKPRFGLNRKKALEEIENGEIKILISSGIAPVFYKSDSKFSRKYKVKFVEYGCEAIAYESLYEYNKAVFEFLDKMYGGKWRRKIRKDVIGLVNN